MNDDEGKLLMMIRYAGSDAGREAYDSMLVELARLRAIEASVAKTAPTRATYQAQRLTQTS